MPPRQRTSEYEAGRQRKPLTIAVQITGLHETLTALRGVPKEANAELRDAAGRLAEDMLGWVRREARGNPQATAVAATAKVARDRLPAIQLGGTTRITSTRAPAWKILFGANFGARRFHQFRPWAGRGRDYFVWRAVEAHAVEIADRWLAAADGIIRRITLGAQAQARRDMLGGL